MGFALKGFLKGRDNMKRVFLFFSVFLFTFIISINTNRIENARSKFVFSELPSEQALSVSDNHDSYEVIGTKFIYKLKTDFNKHEVWSEFEQEYGEVTSDNVDFALQYYNENMFNYFYSVKMKFLQRYNLNMSDDDLYKASSFIYIDIDDVVETIDDIDYRLIEYATTSDILEVTVVPLMIIPPISECRPMDPCDPGDTGGGSSTDPEYDWDDTETFDNVKHVVQADMLSFEHTKLSGYGINIGIVESQSGKSPYVNPDLDIFYQEDTEYTDKYSQFFESNTTSWKPQYDQIVLHPDADSDVDGVDYYSVHANNVAAIAAGYDGIAPRSRIYSTNKLDRNHTLYDTAYTWFKSFGPSHSLNIINMSFAYDEAISSVLRDIYNEYAYSYEIVFIASAGNFYEESVRPPSSLYNIFSVGGTNNTGTDIWLQVPDDSSNPWGSSYINNSDNLDKPNIVAPAQMILTHEQMVTVNTDYYYGTSLSAPLVTGAVALLLEKNEDLKDKNECVYALLMATANNDMMKNVIQTMNQNIGDKTGAGVLQIENLLNNSSSIKLIKYTYDSDATYQANPPVEYSFDLDNPYNDYVHISVASYWLHNIDLNTDLINYDLEVYIEGLDSYGNPFSNLIGSSKSDNNNFELVIGSTNLDGNIVIRILGDDILEDYTEDIGIAWSITRE